MSAATLLFVLVLFSTLGWTPQDKHSSMSYFGGKSTSLQRLQPFTMDCGQTTLTCQWTPPCLPTMVRSCVRCDHDHWCAVSTWSGSGPLSLLFGLCTIQLSQGSTLSLDLPLSRRIPGNTQVGSFTKANINFAEYRHCPN